MHGIDWAIALQQYRFDEARFAEHLEIVRVAREREVERALHRPCPGPSRRQRLTAFLLGRRRVA
ncbi:MAG: hypothetical protein J7480_09950 [Microbacteriaceae bacterium]|nr:hypothetical protein [Microbacteriaceae bacterium]